jgi:diguanylate cyclase (GGDEF)-like protein
MQRMGEGELAAAGVTRVLGASDPRDARQALRLRRNLMAAGTSLLVIVALFAGVLLGALPLHAAWQGAAIILVFIVVFRVLFQTGFNLRWSDPSLTTEQMSVAIVTLAFIMYHTEGAREALSLFYLAALLFGVLRLNTRRLLFLAALAFASHAVMLAAAHFASSDQNLQRGLVQLAVLAVVLPWFAVMGGYVNRLRRRLSDSNRELRVAYDRIEMLALRDELTGTYNRRFLVEAAARERSRALRLDRTFSVCLFDLDRFKSVNDTLGHGVGDAVLRHFAQLAVAQLRGGDLFGRYGGEEFLLILPDADRQEAFAAAERVRNATANGGFPQVPATQAISVTAGVATWEGREELDELIARADRALYLGKERGRNRVVPA